MQDYSTPATPGEGTSQHAEDHTYATDTRLSYKARGVLADLLTRPADWPISVRVLAEQRREGRTALLSAFNELRAAGYMHSDRERGPDGRYVNTTRVTGVSR